MSVPLPPLNLSLQQSQRGESRSGNQSTADLSLGTGDFNPVFGGGGLTVGGAGVPWWVLAAVGAAVAFVLLRKKG